MKTVIGRDINQAVKFLDKGGLVAIPTETVYGLAGNALSEHTVTTIFEVKNRPAFDPLIVHVKSIEEVGKYVSEIPELARQMMNYYWPGPLTFILKKQAVIPDLVTSGLNTVAVRMPSHPVTLELLRQLEYPLAAPSANPFGYVSPTTSAHVMAQLNGKIPYILEGGPCRLGLESTIVGIEENACVIYRQGGVSEEDLRRAGVELKKAKSRNKNMPAPGMLKSHYAPSKPVWLGSIDYLLSKSSKYNPAILCFNGKGFRRPSGTRVYVLSEEGNMEEAARNLFSFMREMDKLDIDLIVAEPVPDEGLGRAINDRLKKAAAM